MDGNKVWHKMGQLPFVVMVLLLATAVFQYSDAKPLDRIKVFDKWMVDPEGRARLFHGFNSVNKGPPWYDPEILNRTKLQLYRDWGFNVVRLGTMWKGIEPSPGVFNYTFMSLLQNIVGRLEEYGMYVILDMHQDVLTVFNTSSRSVGYEGVPLWLVDKFPPSPMPYPFPLPFPPADDYWALGYVTDAVSSSFQHLYKNTSGAVDYMSRFWAKVAGSFRNQTSVLGYELINEPWAGDIYAHPSLLIPGETGSINLMPLYEHLNSVIRNVDDVTLLFYEPVTWGIVINDETFGTGFKTVPGGPNYRNRSVLSFHYYCWFLTEHGYYPLLKRIGCDAILGPKVMNTVLRDIEQTGGSSFLTEFGTCIPDGNPESADTVECEFVMSLADEFLQSWTYWDSAFFLNDTGEINRNVVKSFSRVYARAVAGIPKVMTFDLKTKQFHFEFKLDDTVRSPTEIFVPLLQYPNGFHVNASKQLSWKFDKTAQILYVMPSGLGLQNPNATVDIFP